MDERAIEAAQLRLAKARDEAAKLGLDRPRAKLAWGEFLLAIGGFYSKLEQGAKSSDSSRKWFKDKQAERASDNLLAYLHHARNTEEHGILPVTKEGYRSLEIAPGGMVQIESDGVDTWTVVGASPGAIKDQERELFLSRVLDRKGYWAPPTVHLGLPIDPTPISVAEAALAYATTMLEEAQSLSPGLFDGA